MGYMIVCNISDYEL